MTIRTQPIFSDTPGSLPANYQLPAGLDLKVQSVVARINGAGAAGAFRACLAIYTQDGRLMARAFPNTDFAIGDTGVVTWAPFLRQEAAAAPPPPGTFLYTFIRRQTFPAQVIGTGAWVKVNFTGSTDINQDATRFGVNVVNDDDTDVKKAGRYGFLAECHWDVPFAGLTGLRIGTSGPWAFFPTISYTEPGGAAGDTGDAVTLYVEKDLPGGTSDFDLQVRQESGANKTLESAEFQITYLGDFTNMGTDYDDY